MQDEIISLKKLSEILGINNSQTRKYVLSLGYNPPQLRTPDSRGKLTYVFTKEETEAIIQSRRDSGFVMNGNKTKPVLVLDSGVFYAIQIIPEFDPNRIKLGFAANVKQRLAEHRTSAPTAKILKTWPCKRTWEQTAIDCIAGYGCKLILNEVYECDDLEQLIDVADQFFLLMPKPDISVLLADHSPLKKQHKALVESKIKEVG